MTDKRMCLIAVRFVVLFKLLVRHLWVSSRRIRNTVDLRSIMFSPGKCDMLCLLFGVGIDYLICFLIVCGHVSSDDVSVVVGL